MMRICPNCGCAVPPDSSFCPACGAPVSQQPAPQAPILYPPKQSSTPKYKTRPNPAKNKSSASTPTDGGLSTASYFWHLVLFAVPIIGWVVLLYYAFGKYVTPAHKHLARAVILKGLLFFVIGIVVCVFLFYMLLLQLGPVFDAVFWPYFEDFSSHFEDPYEDFSQHAQNLSLEYGTLYLNSNL